jgi:type II secretory pathway pseudopilin PulG
MTRHGNDRGATLAEILIVLSLMAAMTAVGTPLVAKTVDATRGRQAAGFLASRFRLARQQAVAQSRSHAVVFDDGPGGWQFRVCADGNDNGVRRAEISAGIDSCFEGPYRIDVLVAGTRIAVHAALPGPDGDAPSADPVRFGSSDLASFSPVGSSSSGSIYLQSRDGMQFVVRLGGATGRTRVLRYDTAAAVWRDA